MDRACGECTECCFVLGISELKKPEKTACPNCSKGCEIYESKPKSCSEYRCLWLNGGLADNHRPDRLGLIFTSLPFEKSVAVNVVYSDDDIKNPESDAAKLISQFIDNGYLVAIKRKSGESSLVGGRSIIETFFKSITGHAEKGEHHAG